MNNTILIVLLLVAVFGLMYVINNVNISYKTQKWLKLILFLSGALYVMYDLLMKEKYSWLIALIIGSAGFIYLLFYAKKK